MKEMRLYPKVVVKGFDNSHTKVHTLPRQSLSLHDILKKFLKKESLPVQHEGQYLEGYGDIEKMQHLDISEKLDRARELSLKIAAGKKAAEERAAKAAADKLAKMQAKKASRAKVEPNPPPGPVPHAK